VQQFSVEREVALEPQQAWDRLTDWPRHGDHVPLTRIRVTDDGFVARTGIGMFAFDDPMTIVLTEPPRLCRLVKTGRVIRGDAELRVVPHGARGSRVTWTETIGVRGVPDWAGGLVRWSGRLLFGRVLDRLLA